MGKFSNTLAYMKCFLKHVLGIGFQFWEPPRGALHWSNFDFFIWTPLPNTLVDSVYWTHFGQGRSFSRIPRYATGKYISSLGLGGKDMSTLDQKGRILA